MNLVEFRAALKKDRERLSNREAPSGIKGCAHCQIPLQESITGCRTIGDDYVCSDCYFEELGREIEHHPIGALRISRGA